MADLFNSRINNMTIGHQLIVKDWLRKLKVYGTILLGISIFLGIIALVLMFPPKYPIYEYQMYPPTYNPMYPAGVQRQIDIELERQRLIEKYLKTA